MGGMSQGQPPPEKKHWFPYVDFTKSLIRRFEGSFLFILVVEYFNFGIFTGVMLCA